MADTHEARQRAKAALAPQSECAYCHRVRDLARDVLSLAAENAALREAITLALAGLPDPMHPEIPRQFVNRLVSAQIVLADAIGDDDAGDVAAARSVLAAVQETK